MENESDSRVALADDHALVRAGIRALLEKILSVEVVGAAGTGREALASVKSKLSNPVLMDIAMAELGGGLRLRDARKMRGAPLFLVIAIAALIPLLFTSNAVAAEPKRVLLVHSFGSASPPFTVESGAFETELAGKMGDRVDLDEVSLDMARYPDREMQEAIVDYLQKRQAKWQPDLVVPIGGPASIFVATYRDRLFPETPILYASADRRLLPPGALEKNAAYVGQVYEIPGLLEDMLQIAPATKNIAVIVGATPLERLWQGVFQEAAEPLAGRINFTYFSDLSFKQMQERVSKLPPDSYIFFLLLLRDAAGVTLNADESLRRLHAVANAPINSIFEHQLGVGIVGGRLYQSERVGKEAGRIAIRILRGEPASSFPPTMIERLPPHYDWRELQRWKIDQKLLPPGSTVLFREPTAWDRYWAWITAGVSICLLQGLLITGLGANLVKRRRAERSLTESEARVSLAARELRILSRQIFRIQEEERRHLARELHDEIGQTLSAAKINLKMITPDLPAGAIGRLDDSVQLLDRLLKQVRELSLNLRPPLLDELGLVPTLRWLVDQQAQRAQLRATFTADVNGLEIDPAAQTTCFRLAQEAITNIIRHSGAKSVSVELWREAERLWLSVRDDGAGFDPVVMQQRAPEHSTLGLVSMKERSLLVRGGLEIHSALGRGTEIRAWFPLVSVEPLSPETA